MKLFHKTILQLSLCIGFTAILIAQDLKYIEYDTDLISPSVYKERREKLMQQMGNDAVAVFYSAPERNRNNDVDYEFRQDDNFYYLTGFTEPNAILMLIPKGISVQSTEDTAKMVSVREIIFVQPRNPQFEQWTGRRFGPAGAVKLRGLEYALANDKFKTTLPVIASSANVKTWYVPTFRADFTGRIAQLVQPLRTMLDLGQPLGTAIERKDTTMQVKDPTQMVRKMRIIKSPEEIELLVKATKISTTAHMQAMMSCEPGMAEYQIQGLYEYIFRRMGAEYAGYPCIVGAAENSVILHYNTNRRPLKDGDLLLNDCAAEYHGYSSDVTRTFPVNGKFSERQREIYQIVYDAQNAAIAAIKPGAEWRSISAKADSVIKEGLFNLGLIKDKSGMEFKKFYMHGLGHPVGLDVHDVGQPVMEPGMLYTVEPGIYISEGIEGINPEYYNIGVRIEDVVLVTPDGNKLISADAPREMSAIEELMKKKGIGNQPLK